MSFSEQFILVATVHFLSLISPGQDFAIILRQALTQGRAHSLMTSVGIACGIAVHASLAMSGLAVLIRTHELIAPLIQLLGGSYLIYIAYECFQSQPSSPDDALQAIQVPSQSLKKALHIGFITNLFNVKAILFFLAFFTLVINTQTLWQHKLIFGTWITIVTGLWFALLSLGITSGPIRTRIYHYAYWIDRLMGLVFLGFGLILIYEAILTIWTI